jgi:hypothetical protein
MPEILQFSFVEIEPDFKETSGLDKTKDSTIKLIIASTCYLLTM